MTANENALRKAIVASVIGDIPQCLSYEDMDEIAAMEVEPLSDEEVAEIESLPPYEYAPGEKERLVANGMKVVRYLLYRRAMQERGLPCLDRQEFMNMAVEPVVPEGVAKENFKEGCGG